MMRSTTLNLLLASVTSMALAPACDSKSEPPSTTDEVASPDKTESPKSAENPATPAPAAKPADGWKTYTDEEFGFSVEGPIEPTKKIQPTPTALGTVQVHMFVFSPSSMKGALMVMVTPDFVKPTKDHGAKAILDDGQAGALKTMGGTLTDSADIDVEGNPGRMFRFTANPQPNVSAAGYSKVILRDGSSYQIMALYDQSAAGMKANGERFVDSFKLAAKKK